MVFFILKQIDFTEGFLKDRIVEDSKKRKKWRVCYLTLLYS